MLSCCLEVAAKQVESRTRDSQGTSQGGGVIQLLRQRQRLLAPCQSLLRIA